VKSIHAYTGSRRSMDWRMDSTQALIENLKTLGSHKLVGDAGRAVSWRRFGAGAPLVLLHGGHGSWLHWIRNIERLAAAHEVWVPDMPGFGESDALPADAGFNVLVDAISLSIAQILGHEKTIDLAGFSFGSIVASAVALRRGNVRKLALLGPTGHGGRRRESSPMVNWRRATAQADLLADLKKNLEVLMLHGPVDPLALEIHRNACLQTRYRSKQTSQSATLPAVLEALQLPIMMVWGEHDATGVPQEIGPRYQDARPERRWNIIPGAGHWVQYEAAGLTNDLLLDWFNKC
jgi:pimeloyl-ACP methyl ester carboxylesterase